MLERIRPQVQTMLRIGPIVTHPEVFDTGDAVVDAALTDLAAADPAAATNAEAAIGALTWGQGLRIVSLRSVQEFLWYQLPTKFLVDTGTHYDIADALGALFRRVALPRYAELCTSPITRTVLDAYDTGGRDAGITAYRKALTSGGVEPPDIPGLLSWGGMMGVEEHAAFWNLADHLELAVTASTYTPGGRGWRTAATSVARDYLTINRLELGGNSYPTRSKGERRERWADPRGPGRALLTEACHRSTGSSSASRHPRDNQLPEAFRLRGIVAQPGATRRSGRRLLFTTRGRDLHGADTATLWTEVAQALIPVETSTAAAAEIVPMLLLTGPPPGYRSPVVANALTGEGWRTQDGGPLPPTAPAG